MVDILFVDDEPHVLAGLRRSLRRRRHEWNLSFVGSGAEALAHCAEHPPDVLVTDLCMPEMDGEDLLRAVADAHPDVVRLVLSGLADPTRSLETVHLAHQFLAKPCDPTELGERLERVVHLRALLDDERLRADVAGGRALPGAPDIFLALQRVTAREEASTDDIAHVVERDPTVAATVLKVVNSAFVGLPRTVDTVERAVVLLGVKMVEDIVLAVDAARAVGGPGTRIAEQFQDHATATTMLAQAIAPKALAGPARTAGFLHDLGGLFLAARRGRRLAELARGVSSDELHARIVAEWGVAPCELGAYLIGMWGLPLALVNGVARSASPSWRTWGLAEVLHVADALVHELIPRPTSFSSAAPLDLEGLARIDRDGRLPRWRDQARRIVLGER